MSKIKCKDAVNGVTISIKLGKMGLKHVFLSGDRIAVIGRTGSIRFKGGNLTKGNPFPTHSPRDNLKFLATIYKQIPETIDRLLDLSKSLESEPNLRHIKTLVKSSNIFHREFKALIKSLASKRNSHQIKNQKRLKR